MSDDAPDTSPTGEPPICAAARASISCEGDATYDGIVDPAGPYAEQIQVAHAVSSCMLFAAWLLGWRGHFVGDTIQRTLAGLWGYRGPRIPDVDNAFGIGAQVWWQANPATGAEEHVDGCVVAVERHTLYAMTATVVAGGQRVTEADVDAGAFPASVLGKRCIKQLARMVVWQNSAWTDAGNGRRVRSVLDAT